MACELLGDRGDVIGGTGEEGKEEVCGVGKSEVVLKDPEGLSPRWSASATALRRGSSSENIDSASQRQIQ